MSGYAFHPEAFGDVDEIWEYIAQDSLDAADGVLADLHARSDLCGFTSCSMSISLRTHQTRSRYGSWRFSTGAAIRE